MAGIARDAAVARPTIRAVSPDRYADRCLGAGWRRHAKSRKPPARNFISSIPASRARRANPRAFGAGGIPP
jgi:hypothetical protein